MGRKRQDGRDRGRTHRVGFFGSAGAAALAVAVLVAGPSVAAPVPGAITIHTAPYKGAKASTAAIVGSATCAPARIYQAPHFDVHTGIGGLNISSASTTCKKGTLGQPVTSSASTDAFLQVPVVVRGDHHALFVNVSVDGQAAASAAVVGHCPGVAVPPTGSATQYCDLYAEAMFLVTVRLLNPTGVFVYGGYGRVPIDAYASWDNSTTCSHTGKCRYYNVSSASGNFTGTTNVSVNFTVPARVFKAGNDHFVVWIQVLGEAYTEIDQYPAALPLGAAVLANLDLGSPGHGFKLTSITFT